MENRKLVFSQEVKERERKKVRRLTIITTVIGIILCILIIPLLEIHCYKKDKDETKRCENIAKDIWYNGIDGIKYSELNIKLLDSNIEYQSIYNEGVCYINDKIQLIMSIDNINLIQKYNKITIQKGNRQIATLKFISDENVNVTEINKITYVIFEIASIIIYIFLAYLIITLYKSDGNRRMIIDMNNNHKINQPLN